MSLYLIESENIYFPQIRGYFKEIVSSYDNGNYRSVNFCKGKKAECTFNA